MKTLAYVIGNDNYHESAKLDYAVKDSQGMADVFQRLGYEVVHKTNISRQACVDTLTDLEAKIKDFDATIFFFAGHGFQFEGENYLTSIDCQIPPSDKHNCRHNSIMLSELLAIFKKNPDKINIVIIDACRRSFGRGSEVTFAPVQAPKGTLIAFSTSPDEGAKDGGFGEYGIYTGALLTYIGRELLSVEELFKKVRRTVYNLTNGRQTPWEHTSLIGDFYFNMGQLVFSVDIPYNKDVVKDVNFKSKGDEFDKLIEKIRSYNWHTQNPAVDKLLAMAPASLNKNQQFLLGRNLLQTGDYANQSTAFFQDIRTNIKKYTDADGENHVLNGVLFEIYFNKHGEFRMDSFKTHCFEQVRSLRKEPTLANSFAFIGGLLQQFQELRPFWIPVSNDDLIDIDVNAINKNKTDELGNQIVYQLVNSVNIGTTDLSNSIQQRYDVGGRNQLGLQTSIAHYLAAPKELVNIVSNIPLTRISFPPLPVDDDFDDLLNFSDNEIFSSAQDCIGQVRTVINQFPNINQLMGNRDYAYWQNLLDQSGDYVAFLNDPKHKLNLLHTAIFIRHFELGEKEYTAAHAFNLFQKLDVWLAEFPQLIKDNSFKGKVKNLDGFSFLSCLSELSLAAYLSRLGHTVRFEQKFLRPGSNKPKDVDILAADAAGHSTNYEVYMPTNETDVRGFFNGHERDGYFTYKVSKKLTDKFGTVGFSALNGKILLAVNYAFFDEMYINEVLPLLNNDQLFTDLTVSLPAGVDGLFYFYDNFNAGTSLNFDRIVLK